MSKELIVFTSATCAPCKQLKPELEFQQRQRGFTMRVVEMTIVNQGEFIKYGVRGVPTVVCHENGQEIGRFVGAMTSAEVASHLDAWGL